MLERIVAGVLVIGVLLWGASLLATPDESGVGGDPPARTDPEDPGPSTIAPPIPDDDREVDEDPDDEKTSDPEPRRKGRKDD